MTPRKQTRHFDTASLEAAMSRAGKQLFPEASPNKLEIVLKCDVAGSTEAISLLLSRIQGLEVGISVIYAGVGAVSKSDLLMALSASRLVIGFNVGIQPKLEQWVKEHGVEVRLYNVIYYLTEDLKKIANSMVAREPEEHIPGRAEVIALFKSSHGAVIAGCTVQEGRIAVGDSFRIITAMGPAYQGKITSLHIETRSVKEAGKGQQVGIKILDFPDVKTGDLVECFETLPATRGTAWKPSGKVVHLES